ncbi:MAG: hypothetical protein AAF940_14990, partial [Pseudomonadota bacterium]
MNWADIAYLDVAVTDHVRDHLLAGEAVVIVDRGTLSVRWANGVAAQWLGLPHVGAVLDGDFALVDGAGARQLTSALRRPIDSKRVAAARTSGTIPALIQMALYPFMFRGTQNLDLAVVAFAPPRMAADGPGLAGSLLGLDEDDASAAIIDDTGAIVEATTRFPQDRIDVAQRRDLCIVCAAEDDRMVKRIVETSHGHYAVGVGHLSVAPDRFLFLLMPSASPVSTRPPVTIAPETEKAAALSAKSPDTPRANVAANAEGQKRQEKQSVQEDGADYWSPDELETAPIRFVWKTDRDGVFVDMSAEFAMAVGPASADVIGKSFDDVSAAYAMDRDGDVSAALRQRNTWSGKSVLWPVQDTDLRVPIDLAALPYYDRERNFGGYRGFGIARMADLVVDDQDVGGTSWSEPADEDAATDIETKAVDAPTDPFDGEPPVIQSASIAPMRRASDTP